MDHKINDMKITGIYDIKSKTTGKIIYSGGAFDIEWDWFLNLDEFRRDRHPDEKLTAHFRKYGLDDYEIVVVERFGVIARATLLQKVAEHIESRQPKKKEVFETSTETIVPLPVIERLMSDEKYKEAVKKEPVKRKRKR